MIDVYGRHWPPGYVLCPVCRQPDSCGDCNHNELADWEALELGGKLPKVSKELRETRRIETKAW